MHSPTNSRKRTIDDTTQLDSFVLDLNNIGSISSLGSPIRFGSPLPAKLTPFLFSPLRRGRCNSYVSQEDLTDLEEALSDTCSSDYPISTVPSSQLPDDMLQGSEEAAADAETDILRPFTKTGCSPVSDKQVAVTGSVPQPQPQAPANIQATSHRYLAEKIDKLQKKIRVVAFELSILTGTEDTATTTSTPRTLIQTQTQTQTTTSTSTESANPSHFSESSSTTTKLSEPRVLEFVAAAMAMFHCHNKHLGGGPGSAVYACEQQKFLDQALSLYLQQLAPSDFLNDVDGAVAADMFTL
jgi:hypothetical protein